jgi:hypothetical protein
VWSLGTGRKPDSDRRNLAMRGIELSGRWPVAVVVIMTALMLLALDWGQT